MKRMWFQFICKDARSEKIKDETIEGIETAPISEENESLTPEATLESEGEAPLSLHLTGGLWIFPAGNYHPVVITGHYEELDDTVNTAKLLPAVFNLDIGEMRRLDGTLTRMRDDTFDVMEYDLPIAVNVTSRTALAALFVGDIIHEPTELGSGQLPGTEQSHAYGTALFRSVHVAGHVFDEPFRLRLLELDRFQLVQSGMGWQGQFFQCIPEEASGAAGKALVRYIEGACTAADPLMLLRRAAQRYARQA